MWKQPECTDMIFFVFDAVYFKGENITHLPFEERLRRATSCVKRSEEPARRRGEPGAVAHTGVGCDCRLPLRASNNNATQDVRGKEHAMELWSKRSNMEHRTDGIIFQDADASYEMGTSRKLTP